MAGLGHDGGNGLAGEAGLADDPGPSENTLGDIPAVSVRPCRISMALHGCPAPRLFAMPAGLCYEAAKSISSIKR